MRAWPDRNGSAIGRFLRRRRIRHPQTLTTHRSLLRGFQDAVKRCERLSSRVSQPTLEAWLYERRAEWSASTVLHRACIIDRFLDFLVQEGSIASNPVAELRTKYCVKGSETILRALLATEPDRALEAVRQLPRFGSVLGDLMRNHVALMRTRGFRYDTNTRMFLRFDRFLQRHPELAKEPVSVMLQHWAAERSTAFHAVDCELLGRALAKARRHLDPSVPVPRRNPHPQRRFAREWRRPYIYSPEEVRLLLDIARAYPSPRVPLRPLTLYTMLVVVYCAGLRINEIARLSLGDVDLQVGTITIRETKFFKSRILPLAESVIAALREYLEARRRAGAPQDPDSGLFWHDQKGTRYATQTVAWLFTDILRRAGLKPPRGKTGPRIHDLRHSMVVNRILAWYRAGINPQERLPFLATYLGHRDIHSTLIYITVTQDLLQEAGERFRTFGAHCLQVSERGQP
ncbi:tyrosine-type recombinase/integrase [Myxococcota bacterium]